LVVSVFKQIGLALPLTSSDQAAFGTEISRSQLRPGDLVFFRTAGGTQVTHVGIYSGRGKFIHASTRSRQVRIDALEDTYFKRRFVIARRVL
jgi:cell wall-associated NlpC family hydrolase